MVGEVITSGEKGAKPTESAAFCGWTNNGTFAFTNCWSIATVSNPQSDERYFTRVGKTVVFENCYSLYGTQVEPLDVDPETLGTGAIAYALNGDQSVIKWYQTLGTDDTPVPWDDHKQVYANGEVRCDGTIIGDATYTNNSDDVTTLPQHAFENGFCTICGTLDTNYKTPVEGYYELANGADVLWFSAMVNSGNPTINARLTEDIDMSEVNDKFEPIGYSKYINGFGGIFDGQNHTVSNFYLEKDLDDMGFIGRVLTGMNFKNIVFDASNTIIGKRYVGLVGGNLNTETGDIYLTNVGYEGNVQASGVNAGGLVGCNHGSAAIYHLKNCYVTGTVIGGGESGAISGWLGNKGGTIENCWSIATAEGIQSEDRYQYRCGSNCVTETNLYALYGANANIVMEDVSSGKLTWLLNNETFTTQNWYQTLGEDVHPVFDSTHGIIYATEEGFADVHDANSYETFRSYIIGTETNLCDEIIANQDLIDAYQAKVSTWEDIATMTEFIAAYKAASSEKAAVTESEKAYASYIKLCGEIRATLEASPMENEDRDFLEAYLDEASAVEPGEVYPNGSYLFIIENHVLTNEQVKAEEEYVSTLLAKVVARDPLSGTEVTAIIPNADFSKGTESWEVTYDRNAPAIAAGEGLKNACESWNNKTFDMHQTLEGMKNGIYMMKMNAAYRPYGELTGQWTAGAIYLNDNMNLVMTEGDDIVLKEGEEGDPRVAVDGVNCHLTGDAVDYSYVYEEVEGWVPMGPLGCSYAFNAGRYLNYTAVEVTDGTLTLGIKNMGTGLDKDWLGFGNLHLIYLGTADEASEYLNDVLGGYDARAQQILDFAWSDASDANKYPNISQSLKDQLTELLTSDDRASGEQKMAIINAYSKLFGEVQECRRAYADLVTTLLSIENISSALSEGQLISEEDYANLLNQIIDYWVEYQEGKLSAEEARERIKSLKSLEFLPATDEDGYLLISTPQDLGVFAYIVNSGSTATNARMAADLDMKDVPDSWAPIGTTSQRYIGTFDGQGHKFSNLVLNQPEISDYGMFNTGAGATLKNFYLDSTCSITGNQKVGIVGNHNGSGATFEGIGNGGKVIGDGGNVAGLVGGGWAGSGTVNINSCWMVGEVITTGEKGATKTESGCFFGWSNTGTFVFNDCWSIATVANPQSDARYFTRVGDKVQFFNCYCLYGNQVLPLEVDPATLGTGAIAYKLNGDQTNIKWYQTLGVDETPVPWNDHLVVLLDADGTYYNEKTAIRNISMTLGDNVTVYDTQGRIVRSNVAASAALRGLTKGMYIMKGKSKSMKVLVK